jgi:hypothetical protein
VSYVSINFNLVLGDEMIWIFFIWLIPYTSYEGYCPSRSAVTKFRAEAICVEFMKQWNVGVYFSLRYVSNIIDDCRLANFFFGRDCRLTIRLVVSQLL